jgi:hypothetical protein
MMSTSSLTIYFLSQQTQSVDVMKGLNGSYKVEDKIVTFEHVQGTASVNVSICGADHMPVALGSIQFAHCPSSPALLCELGHLAKGEHHQLVVEHCLRVAALSQITFADISCSGAGESTLLPWSPVHSGMRRYKVPHTTPLGTILFTPTVPIKVLKGHIRIRTARHEDRKQWNQLILQSSSHNIGGSEMLTVTWNAALRLVAVNDSGLLVGVVCMSLEGWIPYITSHGAPHSGLGSFLLFIAMEWFRLTVGHTVGLSPSDEAVAAWYAGWGFELIPTPRLVAITDQVMRRHIDLYTPLLPASIYHYVEGLHPIESPRRSITCILCMGQLLECSPHPPNTPADNRVQKVTVFRSTLQLLQHIERVHLNCTESLVLSRKDISLLFAQCLGVSLCSECEKGFDVHECGLCDRCWYARPKKRSREGDEP